MNKVTFLVVVGLCLVYVALNVGETYMYQTWMRATKAQREVDQKVAFSQRVDQFSRQFVRRIGIDAQTDPALMDLLKKHFPRSVDKNKAKTSPPAKVAVPAANPSHE